MPNPYFKFKQFTVFHDRSTMPVGTDAALLGAWAEIKNTGQILDVGTGCGIIALMLAQRSKATITAIDVDENSVGQAAENFRSSQWSERLDVKHMALSDHARQSKEKYDLIVSNPPYFERSFKASQKARNLARHNDELPLEDLLHWSEKLLSANGRLTVILPVEAAQKLTDMVKSYKLHLSRITHVHPLPGRNAKRQLLEFSRQKGELREDHLVVETGKRHEYSPEFKSLLRDFYLHF